MKEIKHHVPSSSSTEIIYFGAVIGYAIDIDKGIMKFGTFLEKLFFRKSKTLNGNSSAPSSDTLENQSANKKNFPYAFLNSSVLFVIFVPMIKNLITK